MGHHDQFVPTSPSVGCAFGQETFAGMHGNGEEAPIADQFAPEGDQPKFQLRVNSFGTWNWLI